MGHIISLPRRGPSVGRRAVGFAGGGTSRWLKAEGDHDETILGRLMQFSWSPTHPRVTGRCFHFSGGNLLGSKPSAYVMTVGDEVVSYPVADVPTT